MLERTDAITNEVLEPITFVLACPTVYWTCSDVGDSSKSCQWCVAFHSLLTDWFVGYSTVLYQLQMLSSVSATSWLLVQRSPTDCGASLCGI